MPWRPASTAISVLCSLLWSGSSRPITPSLLTTGSVLENPPGPPPVFAALATDPAAGDYDLSSLELIVSGGAPLAPGLQETMEARFPGAVTGQGYGLTETAAVITLPARDGNVPGSAGRVAAGTQVCLADPVTGRTWH